MWNIMQVAIWDERWDGSALKSHLGIVFKDSMTLRIFELRHEEQSRIRATFFREDPAAAIARVISTRPRIFDALVVQPDGTVILLAQGGSAVGFHLIQPTSTSNGESKSPRIAHGPIVGIRDERWSQLTLVYTDGWDERIDMDLCPKSKLVNECMQMLAFVIPQEEYFLLHMDLINQWSSKGRVPDPEIELDAFRSALYALLGVENVPPADSASPWDALSHSPLLAKMREDPALRRLKLPSKAPLPTPKPLSQPPHPLHSLSMYTLHTLAEDLRVLKGRHNDVVRLAPILARLALPVRPEWADYWKRLVPDCLDGWPHQITHSTSQYLLLKMPSLH
jgi:anaphase-promoting complex subunit 1